MKAPDADKKEDLDFHYYCYCIPMNFEGLHSELDLRSRIAERIFSYLIIRIMCLPRAGLVPVRIVLSVDVVRNSGHCESIWLIVTVMSGAQDHVVS